MQVKLGEIPQGDYASHSEAAVQMVLHDARFEYAIRFSAACFGVHGCEENGLNIDVRGYCWSTLSKKSSMVFTAEKYATEVEGT